MENLRVNFGTFFLGAFLGASTLCDFALGSSNLIDEWTFGASLLKSNNQSGFISQLDLGVLDASVLTSPPDQVNLTRAVDGLLNLRGDYVLSNGGLSFSAKYFFTMQKSENEKEPKIKDEKSWEERSLAFDYSFLTSRGLKIILGVEYLEFPEYSQSITSDLISQNNTFTTVSAIRTRVGAFRQGAGWYAGVYYLTGTKVDRSVDSHVLETSESNTYLTVAGTPPEIGIMAQFDVSSIQTYIDFAYLKASESSESSSDGTAIEGDHLRFLVGADWALSDGDLSTIFMHHTLGYGANAFASIETIPFSVLKLKYTQYVGSFSYDMGGYFGFGSDGLSIPEANESFEVKRFGLTTGVRISI
jgi:hypothetical protein